MIAMTTVRGLENTDRLETVFSILASDDVFVSFSKLPDISIHVATDTGHSFVMPAEPLAKKGAASAFANVWKNDKSALEKFVHV